MKRRPSLLIFATAAAVLAFEAAVHWLLGRGTFPTLLAVYLTGGSSGKHFFAGVLDNLLPAAVLGFANGWAGYPHRSPRKVSLLMFGLAIFTASLEWVYRALVGAQNYAIVWGSPTSNVGAALFHSYDVFTAFLTGGFFSYVAYGGRRASAQAKTTSVSS